jgi:hypothetical protein
VHALAISIVSKGDKVPERHPQNAANLLASQFRADYPSPKTK